MEGYGKEQENIRKLGENKVFYLPYLMGERSPHNDPKVRATFIGMTMDTTREDMTQAVPEGVAFGLRDSLEVAKSLGIQIERTKICGGGRCKEFALEENFFTENEFAEFVVRHIHEQHLAIELAQFLQFNVSKTEVGNGYYRESQ